MRKLKFCCVLLCNILLLALVSCVDGMEEQMAASTQTANPTVVDLKTARIELEKLLKDIDNSSATRQNDNSVRAISESYSVVLPANRTRSDIGGVTMHVFNFADNKGFALMSGDTRLPSSFALANNGSFNSIDDFDNPGMKLFINRLEGYCANEGGGNGEGGGGGKGHDDDNEHPDVNADGTPTQPTYYYGPWENTVYHDNGYCPVKWGQKYPYNQLCPTIGNVNAVTGCVATATAQLMATYRFPASHNGYAFDWEQMTASPNAYGCTSSAQSQIAWLMSELGKGENLNMDYGVRESGAYSDSIPGTLRRFRFSNGGMVKEYSNHEVDEELKSGNCVLVSGACYKDTVIVGGRQFRDIEKDTNGFAMAFWNAEEL